MGIHENGEYDINILLGFSHNLWVPRYEMHANECKWNQRKLMADAVSRERTLLDEDRLWPEEYLYGNGQGLEVPPRARRPFSSYAKMTIGGMIGPYAYEFRISSRPYLSRCRAG